MTESSSPAAHLDEEVANNDLEILSETSRNDELLAAAPQVDVLSGRVIKQFGIEAHEKVMEYAQHYVANLLPEENSSNVSWESIKLNDFDYRFVESLISTNNGKLYIGKYLKVLKASEHVGNPRLTKIMMKYMNSMMNLFQILSE